MPLIIKNGILDSLWPATVLDTCKPFLENPSGVNLAGWSMGALIAAGLLGSITVERMLLLSGTTGFCAAPDYSFGWKRSVLDKMQENLQVDTSTVLRRFYQRCLLSQSEISDFLSMSEGYTSRGLINGLQFLQQTQIASARCPARVSIDIFHGDQDKIIPWQAGSFLAEKINASFTRVPGGHVFFMHSENQILIREKINY
jgi:surfactin synthase thioesterase subunit